MTILLIKCYVETKLSIKETFTLKKFLIRVCVYIFKNDLLPIYIMSSEYYENHNHI